MPRPQDILLAILGVALFGLLAFHIEIAVLALVGAFGGGAIYVFKGMIPSRDESFLNRAFISVFLAIVLASLVLIVPGTFGTQALDRGTEKTIVEIAGALPVLAVCFEVLRTPRVLRGILRCFGYR
jgi:hypothetical protein